MTISEILSAFATESLFAAASKLLSHIGVTLSVPTEEPIPFLDLYKDEAKKANATIPKPVNDIFSRVQNTYFIGSVTDDTFKGNKTVDFNDAMKAAKEEKYKGMFIFAVEMKPGVTLKRSEAAVLVRGINRVVTQQPATVLILEKVLGDAGQQFTPTLSIATCERTHYKQTWRPGEKLGKVSILKGINCLAPHRGHIDILESMNVNGKTTFDELYKVWQKVFSTSLLTETFYKELFNWYEWVLNPNTDVYFPNDSDDRNNSEGRDTKIIRLITRILFVWFIRQKKLVPDWIFDTNELKRILKDFDPLSMASGNYYNAVLQNLFFATLNRAIKDEEGKRRFAEKKGQVDAKNLYRYSELYSISKDDIVKCFSSIPFVNGSLFECLDKTKGNDGVGKAFYYDGFSRNDERISGTNHYRYRAFIPNKLFFDQENGLFSIFSRYNFTIEENTPLEQQVALDPELLGKVFENLLGAYNPETKATAREQSGSFYTPREIVDYMVDETLIAYLGDTKLVRNLFSESFVYNEFDWAEYQKIAAKLKTVKVLDPACGSGAFPVGMLNRIVEILEKLKTDKGDVFKLKRHIIENCLYGSDIQCIAAQITKLRFFISLIVNCDRDEKKANFGIPELPNLETKFVAANSLISVKKVEHGVDLFEDPNIVKTTEELRKVRHEHFNANTSAKKRRLVKKDAELRKKLSDLLNGSFFQPEDAQQLAEWNPYDQNTSANFFDPEWMFGIKDGFDIVIGNPPYIQLQNNNGELGDLYEDMGFKTFNREGDIYCLFYEFGVRMLSPNGTLGYITSDKWMVTKYGKATRDWILTETQPKLLVDFPGRRIFDSATVEANILFIKNAKPQTSSILCCSFSEKIDSSLSQAVLQAAAICPFSVGEKWFIKSSTELHIAEKIRKVGIPLKEWGVNIYFGVKTGLNSAFIVDGDTRNAIIAETPSAISLLKPILRGRDIHKYWSCPVVWLIGAHNGIASDNVPRIDVSTYPSVKRFMDQWNQKLVKRCDQGDTPYNLRDCAYWHEFSKEKICWKRIGSILRFSYNDCEEYGLDSTCIMTGEHIKFLLAVLNSTMGHYLLKDSPRTGTGDLLISVQAMEPVRVPRPATGAEQAIVTKIDAILDAKKADPNADTSVLEAEIDEKVFDLYGLSPEEREIVKGAIH